MGVGLAIVVGLLPHALGLLPHARPPLLLRPALTRAAQPLASLPPNITFWDEAGAASLIAGTAIGGGFLALPYTTAPAGALPSGAALLGVWSFLLAESLIIVDLVLDASSSTAAPASFSSAAEATLGRRGALTVRALFLVLMVTTLVSQFAKGGELLCSAFAASAPGLYAPSVGAAAALVCGFALLAPRRTVSRANALLTAGFGIALAATFASAAPIADASLLARAGVHACVKALPSLLQLLVYCEVSHARTCPA